jgi:uncharacterized protein YjbK
MKKEIELKYCLKSKSDFELFGHLIESYVSGKKSIYQQENFYFDTPNLNLKRNGISLRLRKQNEEYRLSAKKSLDKKKHLSVRLEYENVVETSIAQLIRCGFLSPIDAFSFLPSKTREDFITKKSMIKHMKKAAKLGLQIIGSFLNERTCIPIKLLGQNLSVEFDYSIYPKSIEVYEIEIEFESEKQAILCRPAIESLFRSARIKTHQSGSKSSKLYKILFG